MRYLDTSLVVAAITNERDTAKAQRALTSVPAGERLLISDWVDTEVSAALSAKVRMGVLSESDRGRAWILFETLAENSFTRLPVVSGDFVAAGALAQRYRSGLRAGDALHLAVAARVAATVYTFDKGLVRAARALRIAAALVS